MDHKPFFSSTLLHFDEMETKQRADAAEWLFAEGEMRLLKGDVSGIAQLDLASQLNPTSASLFYRQGLALFEYGSQEGKEKALLLASKKFKSATLLDPNDFEAWQAWGNTLALLGTIYKEHHYFIEAEEKYRHAAACGQGQSLFAQAELLWDQGVVWSHIADHSEEAIDWNNAREAFERAHVLLANGVQPVGSLPSEFWLAFGETCLALHAKLSEIRYLIQAIQHFKQATALHISSQEGWEKLGKALCQLYEYTHEEEHFTQADECFASAIRIAPNHPLLWLEWAQFLGKVGMRQQQPEKLRRCIEKCEKGNACNPKNPLILATWGEALAFLGALEEKIELIYEGQNKISEALEIDEESPETWYAFGIFLCACGFYFEDTDSYYQAIEKFQYGLSIDRTRYRHWHAIATAYAIIAQLDADATAFERSQRFFLKALEINPSAYYRIDYAIALSRFGEMENEPKHLEEAVHLFQRVLSQQKNALYLHPEWWFSYAYTLDLLGDFHEEESYYKQAIEIFSHVLIVDPDFPEIHHRLGVVLAHLGSLNDQPEYFYRAIHHYRLAAKKEPENDQLLLDEGITLIHIAEQLSNPSDRDSTYRCAEHKLLQAAKLGNLCSYYQLSCLYSLTSQFDRAMTFLEMTRKSDTLPPIDELLGDEWLDNLRNTSPFQAFLDHLEKK